MDRDRCAYILPVAIVCAFLTNFVNAQQTSGTTPSTTQGSNQSSGQGTTHTASQGTTQGTAPDRLKCRHPANPHRRRYGCNDEEADWDETLAHRWSDLRAEMRRLGITPTASYVSALQTNVTGGSHQVWSYAGQLSVALSADLQELLKIRGMSAYVGTSWGTGSNLAGTLNSSLPPNGLYAPAFYLGEFYLQQKFLKGNLKLRGGRLAASTAFATLPVFNNYVTYGINPNPYSIGANDISFFGPPPGTEWGLQAVYTIRPAIQVTAGAFNTNENSANGENHGTDFTLQQGNKGVLAIGEIDYLRNQRLTSHGKPGQIGVGFLYSSNSFPLLNNNASTSNGYSGVYVVGQQMVYRPGGPGTSQGATVWGTLTHNSKEMTSVMPLFSGGGVSYEGLIPARKSDVLSVGLVYGQASKYAPALNTEELLELNYQWNLSRYIAITPHFQYIWQQDGPAPRDGAVLGIQLAITF